MMSRANECAPRSREDAVKYLAGLAELGFTLVAIEPVEKSLVPYQLKDMGLLEITDCQWILELNEGPSEGAIELFLQAASIPSLESLRTN